MVNLHELLNTPPERGISQCRVAPWLSQLSQADQDAIWAAFDNEQISTRHIYHTLKTIGFPNAESSLRSHRRGECQQCERTKNNAIKP